MDRRDGRRGALVAGVGYRHPDGGISEGYAGSLTLQGVTYDWRAWVYSDSDGARFLSDLSAFEPKDWRAEIRMVS